MDFGRVSPRARARWASVLGVVVEGACDRWFGRPLDANPYCPVNAADAWRVWQLGWSEAAWMIDVRGAAEAARWLREAA